MPRHLTADTPLAPDKSRAASDTCVHVGPRSDATAYCHEIGVNRKSRNV